jgi:hypothetical protein
MWTLILLKPMPPRQAAQPEGLPDVEFLFEFEAVLADNWGNPLLERR